ncbi:DUF7927 domain-containing protein [Cellulomonas timonensis]|uniref:DUF7927 domain-containing protein n=1 Tax=Cellulomonas timonensis TaxID=1689271 RepID=UPI000ABEFF15|nr:DUF11 domain-containing protein [Cellulomonas timonensis]
MNGAAAVPDGEQPDGLEATLLLDGDSTPWGEAQTGYTQGDTVSVSETTQVGDVDLCEIVGATIRGTTIEGTVDLEGPFDLTLAKGANELTVTNEVECTSRLRLFMTTNDGFSVAGWTLGAEGGGSTIGFADGLSGVEGQVSPNALYELTQSPGDPRYVSFINSGAVAGTTASWVCEQVDAQGDSIPGFTDGIDGDVTVPLGYRVECTALNQAATLRLIKNVDNSGGGIQQPDHWTLHTEPVDDVEGIAIVSQPGSTAGFAVTVRPDTEYYIWETAPPTLGYTLVGPTCTDGTTSVPVRAAGDGRYIVTLAVNTVVSCTFLNDDGPAVWKSAKTSNPPTGTTVARGDLITYTVTASYVSGVEARDVVVVDDLAGLLAHAEIVSGPTATAGSVVREGSTFRWTLPVLASTESITFTARVTATSAVTVVNSITPSAGGTCDPCRTAHPTRVVADPAVATTPLAATGGQVLPAAAFGLGALTLGAILLDQRRRRLNRL